MKGCLCGLAHRTTENQKTGQATKCRRLLIFQNIKTDRTEHRPHHEDTQQKTEIPDAVCHERLFRRIGCAWFLEPKANQQITRDADQLPKDEHHHEVVGQHDAEHRKNEQTQEGEVAGEIPIFLHIAQRENVN